MKKILSTILAIVLISAIFVFPASAAKTPEIELVTENFFLDFIGNPIVYPEETRPGDEILIPLERTGFKDADGAYIDWNAAHPDLGPTAAQLKFNRVGVLFTATSGKYTIRDISIVEFTPTKRIRCQSAIRIRFVEDIDSTKEIKYEFKLQLTHNGDRVSNILPFDGMISNELIHLINVNDYVNTTDGNVAISDTSVDKIRLDMGPGISLYTNLIKDEKFLAYAKHIREDGADAVVAEYFNELYAAYEVKTINLKTDGDIVKFTDIPVKEKYFVYNVKGEYIGMSDKILPYSTKYYLAKKEIDIAPELLTVPPKSDEISSNQFLTFQENMEKNLQN